MTDKSFKSKSDLLNAQTDCMRFGLKSKRSTRSNPFDLKIAEKFCRREQIYVSKNSDT